jgi:hypothetical protein
LGHSLYAVLSLLPDECNSVLGVGVEMLRRPGAPLLGGIPLGKSPPESWAAYGVLHVVQTIEFLH